MNLEKTTYCNIEWKWVDIQNEVQMWTMQTGIQIK